MKRIITLILSVCLLIGIYPIGKAEAFSEGDISAESAILIEADSGRVIFEKNAHERRQMASTTKIMSALLCIESGGLDEYFKVDNEAIKVEGSSMGLVENDIVTKRVLCYGMLLPSGNDAANATAVKVGGSVENFVAMMNRRAQQMGLNDTHFVTPSGLDDDTDDHYSTAYDMAMLARECMKNETFAEIAGTSSVCLEYGNPPYRRWLSNSNKLLETCEGVNGVKTGFTDKAGRCLISSCERNGVKLICVTLNAPNDWQDHNRMLNFGFSQLVHAELECDYYSFSIKVVGGKSPNLMCSVKDRPFATLYADEVQNITSEVILPKFVYAPIALGEKIGEIRFLLGDEVVAVAEICSNEYVETEEVDDKGVLDKIRDKIGEFIND